MARWLRKIDETTLWPWTEALAKRKDMVEVVDSTFGAVAVEPKPPSEPLPETEDDDVADPDSPVAIINAITEKDDLSAYAKSMGLSVNHRKTLDNQKAELLDTLGLSA